MTDSEQIRESIEQTRVELSGDVDALAEKVRPSSIAHRQVGKVRGALSGVKDRVMGVAEDAGDAMSSAGDAIAEAPRAAKRTAEGHPVAVGLIAFGVGLLASSLIPSSRKEQELAGSLKEQAQPLVGELGDAAKESAQHLKQPAQDAMDAVRGTAQEAVEDVRSEATGAASDVKERATGGGQGATGAPPPTGSTTPGGTTPGGPAL
jgi:ElaB/YqjD/DUF883 family membrane-anchored ribosome-binding protein